MAHNALAEQLDSGGTGRISFPADSLDPTVTRLGLICGILSQGSDKSQLELDTRWFENPLASSNDPLRRTIRTIPTNPQQRAELLALFEEVLGSVSAESLGIPTVNSGRKWYPIRNPADPIDDTASDTGLYLVSEERNAGAETVIGLGARHTFTFSGVLIQPYAYIPFLRMPPASDGNTFVLGQTDYPMELGIDVTSPDGKFGTDEVSFDGVKVAALIRFAENPLSLDLVLLNLKLPGQPAADASVNDILKTPASEWVATGVYLLVSQLVKAAPPELVEKITNAVDALLKSLGLVGEIPEIDWDAIVKTPARIPEILTAWLKSIASDPVLLGKWLNDWDAFIHGTKAGGTPTIEGSGTRLDPYRIELVTIDGNRIDLTIATAVDPNTNALLFYPGVALQSKTAVPVASLPTVGVRMQAAVELLEVTLPAGGAAIPPPRIFPSFRAEAALLNPTAAFASAQADGTPLITIDAIEAGFDYREAPKPGTAAAGTPEFLKGIYPTFLLKGVNTPYGAWDSIDLTNFDEVVQNAGELLANLVVTQLQAFFNVSGNTTAAKMAASCAAVLGVQPPRGYTTATWPVKQLLLTGPGGVQAVITDPLAALAGYYQRCLTTKEGNKTAWELLLPSFAGVIGDVGALDRGATGTGTPNDPWQVELFSADPTIPAAYLQSWNAAAVGSATPVIRVGIAFKVPLPVSSIAMGFTLRADVVDISLPSADGKGSSASWLPDAYAEFRVTGPSATPLVTPALGGVSISSDAFLIAAAWTRNPASPVQAELPASAFFAQLGLKNVKLLSNGTVVETIGDIEFTFTPTSWTTPDLGKFTQLFFDAAGIWVLTYGGGFGVTLVSAFGLSPNLSSVFNNPPPGGYTFALPPGVTLPATWPKLNVTSDPNASFFTNPWRALRDQVLALLATEATAKPMMQILGWSIDGNVPTVAGAGTVESPWAVTLPGFWDITPLFWTVPAAGGNAARLGFGVQRAMLDEAWDPVNLQVTARIDLAEVDVVTGKAVGMLETLPRAAVEVTLSNTDPSKPVVDYPPTGLRVGVARLGCSFDPKGVKPHIVLLDARYNSGTPLGTFTLAEALDASNRTQTLETLTYALMAVVTPLTENILAVESIIVILTAVDLMLPADFDGVSNVNLGGWMAMAADPPAYFAQKMVAVVENPAALSIFHDAIFTLLGYPNFELPPELKGLPDVLVALGLATHPAGGYALRAEGWISLFTNPVQYLTVQGKKLLDPLDDSVRLALVTALSKVPLPPGIPLADLPLTIENNTLITLRIPADKLVQVGDALAISAKLVANVQSLSLATEVNVACPFAGLALVFTSELAVGASLLAGAELASITTRWGLALDGVYDKNVPPPFPPVVFYPLPTSGDTTAYLKQLGFQIPITLVSTFASQMVNSFVIGNGVDAKYPVVYRLMKDFGFTIANADPAKLEQVQSLAGFMMHPWEWVTSTRALGNGQGGFDLDKIGNLMHDLPGPNGVIGPANIKLEQDGTNGMKITGLPFGTSSISFKSDSTNGIQIGAALQYIFNLGFTEAELLSVQNLGVTPQIDIALGMAFGKGAGVGVSGSFKPTFIFDITDPTKPTALSIRTGYDSRTGFVVALSGQFNGSKFPPESSTSGEIFLVPFGGLSQFMAGVAALLDFAANQLIQLYDKYKASPGHDPTVVAIVDAILGVTTFFGITSVATLYTTFEAVRTDPIAWLFSYFDTAKLPGTFAQLVTLFGPSALNLPGFSSAGTLLNYRPPSFPVDLGTLDIVLGQKDGTFGVWVVPALDKDWVAFGANTGIALTTPLGGSSDIVFTLSASGGIGKAILPSQMTGAPTLTLGLSAATSGNVKYFLRFYPAGTGDTSSTLLVQLLPPPPIFAYGNAPGTGVAAAEWIPKFVLVYLVPLIADIVLQTEQVTGWLNAPLVDSKPNAKPGPMLTSWGLLVVAKDGTPVLYGLHDIPTMFTDGEGKRLPPETIIQKLFFVVLEALSGARIVPIGADGGIYIQAAPAPPSSTDYGLRVVVPDLVIWGGSEEGKQANGSTKLTVQLGKWMSGREGCPQNWIVASDPALKDIIKDPGVLFYFVRYATTTNALSFHTKLQLNSVGVDFSGTNDKPLINVKGFQVGKFEPRVFLSLDMNTSVEFQVGGAIECTSIGVPLGPAQISGITGNTNPVAQNLLTSGQGSESGSGSSGSTTDSVNPTFSIDLGYVYDPKNTTALYAKLFSDQDKTAGCATFIWIPIQRSFGPIECRQVGFGWETLGPLLDLGFDGSVTLAGLSLGLVHLKVGIPVTTPTDYSKYKLDLEGINVSYKGGPVAISGGFLKTVVPVDGQDVIVYTGQAMIKAATFTLGAFGSYGLIGQDTPSLFIFAYINTPIGGPPYFFVEGLAGGFGFNRSLETPNRATDIFEFPFVAGVIDPNYFAGNDPDVALTKLANVSLPARGQYWLAVGLKFSSFQMIHTFALLTASFGADFELNLMGIATIELPVTVPGGNSYTAIARAEMSLLVSFRPSVGLLAVEAALSRNSYVLDKECRLTGGFAFFVWFPPSQFSGDFVITFGGYHPRYTPPDHYPDEPRVGFTWLMPQYNVTIRGGVYFALVPTAIMAGGYLDLQYRSGNLRAWFTAQADMLISWKPFYFDFYVGISVGASYRVNLLFVSKTFSIELGAQLNIWGPPTGGKVRVSWWVISFTIYFGPGKESKRVLQWQEFNESFLPQSSGSTVSLALGSFGAPAVAPVRDARIDASVSRGLVKSFIVESSGEIVRWVIDPQAFEIVTSSKVPVTTSTLNATQTLTEVLIPIPGTDPVQLQRVPISQATTNLGMPPMRVTGMANAHTITITKAATTGFFFELTAEETASLFDIVGVTANVPKAMWNPTTVNDLDKNTTIPNTISGVRITAKPYVPSQTLPVPADKLEFAAPGVSTFSWGTIQPPTQPQYCNVPKCTPNQVIEAEMTALQSTTVLDTRRALISELARAGLPVTIAVDTSLLAQTANQLFLAAPVLVPLGGLTEVSGQAKGATAWK